ncbi:MAG: Outer membrane protein assembly factor BamD [Chlamydiae bacterium]|nr:Outer membrane protein assembly factor BamD [Chlamydiota bacterium]
MNRLKFLVVFLSLSLSFANVDKTASEKVFDGISRDIAPYATAQEHYQVLQEVIGQKEWQKATDVAERLIVFFPKAPFTKEVHYFIAVAYFHQGRYDFSNRHLNFYLKTKTPMHFDDALQLKYNIAMIYGGFEKWSIISIRQLAKRIVAKDKALNIFDEIIATVPGHMLAANALFYKAKLLCVQEEYKESRDTYLSLVRNFYKNELAPHCYVGISETFVQEYLDGNSKDPAILEMANLNLEQFQKDYPRSEEIQVVKGHIALMREEYAIEMFEIGKFFEFKKKKPKAALLYYEKIVTAFPETNTAKKCQSRIKDVQRKLSKA